jgi:hypothetical protein
MDGEGFEPSKASLTDLQSAPFGHSGTHPINFELLTIVYNLLVICPHEYNFIHKPTIGLEPITC